MNPNGDRLRETIDHRFQQGGSMTVRCTQHMRLAVRRWGSHTVLCLALVWTATLVAQSQEVLRNADVVTMTTARLGAETVVLKIETSATQFDTTADALAVLKAAGVADSVIAAMIKSAARTAPAPTPAATPTSTAIAPSAAPSSSTTPAVRPTRQGGRPLLLVQPLRIPEAVTWPYDAQQLQTQTVLILKTKDNIKNRFDVSANGADAAGPVYTLEGEVISWRAGNRATRLIVGMGAGRESADIRYWLTDEKGVRVLERQDTIRAAFIGNAVAGSVGQLAEPFASKIADRLDDVNVSGR
jgi:hypothetical protein